MGGGDPHAPNTQKDNVRGLALHFDLGKDTTTDLVMISAPVFVATDPDQFLKLLTTVATKDKDKIGAYFKDNPNSTNQATHGSTRDPFLRATPPSTIGASTPSRSRTPRAKSRSSNTRRCLSAAKLA